MKRFNVPGKLSARRFRVKAGAGVDLGDWPTLVAPMYDSDVDYRERLQQHVTTLSRQQELLYASDRYAVLVIFQAMDAAGKDGAIKHVMSGINPQGCQVYSFKHPTATELDHDFLWRAYDRLPARGQIGIFNRSYYEEVLIVRVHPSLLAAEKLPDGVVDDRIWKRRYRSILNMERHLDDNGTHVVKIFLHLSREEQRRRFLARLDDPDKTWKFNAGDVEERKCWPQYMKAYEHCIEATTTKHAPWYIVPADDKQNARLIVSRILIEVFEGLRLEFPRAGPAERKKIRQIRRQLASENGEQ